MNNPWKRRVEIGDCVLYEGDCLEIMSSLGKVDACISDPPYGTTQNVWDVAPDLRVFWGQLDSCCKESAAVVLCAAEPFMACLVQSNVKNFKYDLVWIKSQAVGHLNASIMPMRNHENIAVFGRGRITYNPQLKPKPKQNIRPVGERSPSENYGKFGEFAERSIPMDMRYPQSAEIIENVNVGEFAGHPTQKPVKLFRDLVFTYSNERETILDPFMGSGTTLVACAKTGRRGIGIELDPDYFDIACERVRKAYEQPDMFIAQPERAKPVQQDIFSEEDAAQ